MRRDILLGWWNYRSNKLRIFRTSKNFFIWMGSKYWWKVDGVYGAQKSLQLVIKKFSCWRTCFIQKATNFLTYPRKYNKTITPNNRVVNSILTKIFRDHSIPRKFACKVLIFEKWTTNVLNDVFQYLVILGENIIPSRPIGINVNNFLPLIFHSISLWLKYNCNILIYITKIVYYINKLKNDRYPWILSKLIGIFDRIIPINLISFLDSIVILFATDCNFYE